MPKKRKSPKFTVWATFSVYASREIEADSLDAALEKAKTLDSGAFVNSQPGASIEDINDYKLAGVVG